MLVLDGHPVELEAHLERLQTSLAELFPAHEPPPLDLPAVGNGSLRLAVAPGTGGELAVTTDWRPATGHFAPDSGGESSTEGLSLRSRRVAGGLGPHKWADRRLLEEAEAALPDEAVLLIVGEDGTVLEASRANLFAVRGGILSTPPTDGRILPGITRMRVLEIAAALGVESHETSLSRDDLLAADEVFLSGSVRGIERASGLDGAPLGSAGDLSDRIAAALRRAWAGAKTAAAFG
jgi:para-aminobenzoate synthetase / 4-amino-4-deoxychorismate lyase